MGMDNVQLRAFIAERGQRRAALARFSNLGQRPTAAPWLRIENAATDVAELWIYDTIGFDWWSGGGVTAKDFVDQLHEITAPNITVHINSPGGDVFDGLAIYSALKDHSATITTRIEGLAASAASSIAMAGDKVIMASHAMMMIHDPFSIALGNADDLRKEADVLDVIAENIAGIYADHGGKRTNWRAKMKAETWYSDQGAVDAGLADEVAKDAAVKNSFDLSIFANVPKDLKESTEGSVVQHITNNYYGAPVSGVAVNSDHGQTEHDGEDISTPQDPPEGTGQSDGLSVESARLLIDLAEAEMALA